MTEPLKYAIGDFIKQALTESDIRVSSDRLVYRRYMDSRDILEIAIRASLSEGNLVLDSGGEIVEMNELAIRIRDCFSPGKPIKRSTVRKVRPDMYFSTSTQAEELAERFKVNTLSLQQQLIQTKNSVVRSLER